MRHVARDPARIAPLALLFLALAGTTACGHDAAPAAVTTTSADVADAGASEEPSSGAPDKPGRRHGAAPPKDLPTLPAGEGRAPVGLDGSADTSWPPPIPDAVPKLAALAIDTPVFSQADVASARLGSLRTGAVVEVEPRPITGKGC